MTDRQVIYYESNLPVPTDISDDVMSFAYTEEYNTLWYGEIVLNNKDGKYSDQYQVPPLMTIYNVPKPMHDIEILLGGTRRFYGYIVTKEPDIKDGKLTIKAVGYEDILTYRVIRCWARVFLNKTIYQILTSGDARITRLVSDTGVMDPAGPGYAAELNTGGVVTDAKTNLLITRCAMPTGGYVIEGLKILADLIGYWWYVKKTIHAPPAYRSILTLYFKPKGTSVTEWVAQRGVNLVDNKIIPTQKYKTDRVVVEGDKTLGIVMSAGAPDGIGIKTYSEQSDLFKSTVTAQERANYLLSVLNQDWYEGYVEVTTQNDWTFDPKVDDVIYVKDPQNKMDKKFRISKVECNGDDSGVDWRIYIENNPHTYAKTIKEINLQIKSLDTFRTDQAATDSCILGFVDSVGLSDRVYIDNSPYYLDYNLASGTITFVWLEAQLISRTGLTLDTFLNYKLFRISGAGIPTESDTLVFSTASIGNTTCQDTPGSGTWTYRIFTYFTNGASRGGEPKKIIVP